MADQEQSSGIQGHSRCIALINESHLYFYNFNSSNRIYYVTATIRKFVQKICLPKIHNQMVNYDVRGWTFNTINSVKTSLQTQNFKI